MNIFKALLHKTGGDSAKRSITWYCGDSWEDWGPESLHKGVAGSQQAVIYLSREWAKMGHSVKVYNRCGSQEGLHEGVEHAHFSKFNKDDSYDVLIFWRENTLGMLDHPYRANRICLELQDIPFHRRWFEDRRLEKVDRIFVKSRFHFNTIVRDPKFKNIPRKKFVIIPNGISLEGLPVGIAKDRNKLIYASNYSRGLEYMLKWGWPIIKREVPAAELHIFYGWEQHDSYRDSERDIAWKNEMVRLMDQPGVTDHGRVGRERLLTEKASSVIHYYGSVWPETDCISVRESASVGCVPVTTSFGPLGEKKYCIKVKGDPRQPRTQERLAGKIVGLLKNPTATSRAAEKVRMEAMKDRWERIAKLWLGEF